MPIIPISPTPAFGDDDFPSVEGFWLVNQFANFFAINPASTLDQGEIEQFCNNEESIVTP